MTTLTNLDEYGHPLTATFLPEKGMNLISYRRGECEIIDQTTRGLFEDHNAGLGALIGPHFHHRKQIPTDFDTTRFPHIARLKVDEPFSHGIARYAPWRYVASTTQIQAKLLGSMKWNGIPLKMLEGFDFEMTLDIRLLPSGLVYHYSVRSDGPSVLGLHTYYALAGKSCVKMDIGDTHKTFPIDRPYDDNFKPTLHYHSYRAILETESHQVHITYLPVSDAEYSCQLFHPKGASYACIEPLTARNPREPLLNYSAIEVKIEIL